MLDALHDIADPPRHVPARGGRGQHGRGVREADRPPGDLLRHARAGRDAGVGRRAHGVPGLDAADPARRPGRLAARGSARRSRSSTTARIFGPLAKWVAQIDRADRIPELVARAFANGDVRAARAGRARAAGGHARRASGRRRRVALRAVAAASRPSAELAGSGSCSQGGAAARDRRRSRLDAEAARRSSALARGERAARVRRVRRRQDYVDNDSPCYAGHLGIGIRSRARRSACATPTCCSSSARGSARSTTSGYTLLQPPAPRRRCPRPSRTRTSSVASTEPSCAILASGRRSSLLRSRARPRSSRAGATGRTRRAPTTRRWQRHAPLPGARRPGRRAWRSCARGCRPTRSSRTARATSPSGRTASALPALPHPARAARAARWGTASRRRSRRSWFTRTATSSASRVTATS